MWHGKMLLRNQAENISVLTQIWGVRKLPQQPKFQGEFSKQIRESYNDKKIYENNFYEILVKFSEPFSIIQAFTAL